MFDFSNMELDTPFLDTIQCLESSERAAEIEQDVLVPLYFINLGNRAETV